MALRRFLVVAVSAAALSGVSWTGAGAALPAECTQATGVVTCTYTTTGAASSLTIPAGATAVTILADGAPGGMMQRTAGNTPGGDGAEAGGGFGTSLDGQTLTIEVGQAGAPGSDLGAAGAGAGGWPNGGSGALPFGGGAGGGGGSSSVASAAPLVVAAGGGGAGADSSSSAGGAGGNAGAVGLAGGSTQYAGGGGGGGGGSGATPGSGGAAGAVLNPFLCTNGRAGTSGGAGAAPDAGTGGNGAATNIVGGGGGGGYSGGGGGGSGASSGSQCSVQRAGGGGGGGGGSFVDPSASSASILDGSNASWTGAAGRVVITYRPAVSVVRDGGFENPVNSAPVRTVSAPKNIAVWQVTAGSVDVVAASYWPPAAGSQSIDLAGLSAGTIQQTLTLPTSGTYRIGFKMAGNPDCGAQTVKMAVLWNGVSVKTFSFNTSGHTRADLGWVAKSVNVTGTAGNATLAFQNTSAGSCGATLDAVIVKQVA